MLKKINIFIISLFLITFSLFSQTFDGTLTVALINDIPPVSYMNNREPEGLFTDIINTIAFDNNWKINYIYDTFPNLLQMVQENKIDIMVGLIKTQSRQELLYFNNTPVLTSWSQIFVNKDTHEINNILDLDGKKIGVMNSDQNGINFINIADSFDIHYELINYPQYLDLEEAIVNKKVDAGIFFSIYSFTKENIKSTDIIFTPNNSYFAINKQRYDLYFVLETIDNNLMKWKRDQKSIYYVLMDKYFKTIEKKIFPSWLPYIIIFSIFIFLLLFMWGRFLKKRIKKQIIQLYEKDENFKQLFKTINQGIIYFNLDSTVNDINPAAEKMFNLEKEEIINKTMNDLNIISENEKNVYFLDQLIKDCIELQKENFLVLGVFNNNENIRWLNASIIPEFIDKKISSVYITFDDITDLKLALDTIEDREKETNKIIDNMAAGFAYHKIYYDENGNAVDYEYIKTNNEFHKLTELSFDIIGKKASQIFDFKDDENIVDDNYSMVAKTQNPRRIEKYMENIGKWFDISIYSPKEGYFATIFYDSTDRKNNEQILKGSEDALRENQKRLSTTFESIGDGVIAVDNQFKVTMMNKVAKNILNWDSGYYGTDLDKILNLKDINIDGRSIKNIAVEVFETKKPYYINQATLHIEKTNETKIIEDSISPIYNGDIMYGLVIVFRDITDKIEFQEKNEELENQLNQAQKMESVGQFAGGIAHNFNNIITTINGYVSIIENEIDDSFKLTKELNEIKLSANRASALTNQLLTVSRKQSTNPSIVDPKEIISSLSSMMKSLVGEDIIIENNFNSKNKIKADRNQIEQIILNFVANSRDALLENFDKEKRIVIKTEDCFVKNNLDDKYFGVEKGEYVIITFYDNGPGIDQEIRDKIFDPFFTTKEKDKGTGLGLSTIYGIVKQNNATIHVFSEKNNGTTFQIFWPVTFEKEVEVFETDIISPKKNTR